MQMPGHKHRTGMLVALVSLFAASVVAVMAVIGVGDAAPGRAASSPRGIGVTLVGTYRALPSCTDVSRKGALHIVGKRILKSDNRGFAYYGITVYGGLELGASDAAWEAGSGSAMAQIKASTWWHANTVRIQLAEQNVFIDGNARDGLNTAFLDAVCNEVRQIRRQGQEVVISDQTEWPDWTESNPTQRTVNFWRVFGTIYRNQPGISFDLYNEPRLNYPRLASSYHGHYPKINLGWVWRMWRNGGRAAGQTFIGMQQLFTDVRKIGANNIVWIEGPFYDDSLGEAVHYPIRGKNIVWSIHHPVLDNVTNWKKFFGYLARSYPMVDGEWSQFAGPGTECRRGAEKIVPVFLRYLRAHNIGMIGWSLQPGAMLADPHHYQPTNLWVPRDTTDPTHLRIPSRMFPNYSCSDHDIGEGAGRQLMNYFKAYSHLPG
jgi:hypothetical protein